MGRHEAPASAATFDQCVSEYVTGRARELLAQFDDIDRGWTGDAAAEWIGSAAEILRELTRDA